MGDQIETYQVDGGWEALEYTSPVRLGFYGLGLIFAVACLVKWIQLFRGNSIRRSR